MRWVEKAGKAAKAGKAGKSGKTEEAVAGAARTLGKVNALLAAGMALAGGAFLSGSLGCGIVDSGSPMDRGDSLAVVEIFSANGLAMDGFRSAVEVDQEGKVVRLSLAGRGISVLPPEIGDLDRLQTLYLGENKLETLPEEMEKLISLATLEAHENDIASLPDGLRFESLRSVDLHGNRIASLPGNFDITSVERLDLSGNQLASLPADFRYLVRLKSLDLEGNRLESLDVDFSAFADLASLDISHNALASLPLSLAGLDPAYLDAGNNRLCLHPIAEADTAAARLAEWLDAKDRDWKDTQTCP